MPAPSQEGGGNPDKHWMPTANYLLGQAYQSLPRTRSRVRHDGDGYLVARLTTITVRGFVVEKSLSLDEPGSSTRLVNGEFG